MPILGVVNDAHVVRDDVVVGDVVVLDQLKERLEPVPGAEVVLGEDADEQGDLLLDVGDLQLVGLVRLPSDDGRRERVVQDDVQAEGYADLLGRLARRALPVQPLDVLEQAVAEQGLGGGALKRTAFEG